MKLLAVFLLVFSMMAVTIANPASSDGEPGDDQSISCPFGWTLINSRCFQYVANGMTWAEAERNCLSMGANLASIHKYRQIQTLIFTASHESKEVWIGGSNAQEESIWLWSDGNLFSHTNWCPGEPSNYTPAGVSQRCLQINYSDAKCWDDFMCSGRKPSVCAKKA